MAALVAPKPAHPNDLVFGVELGLAHAWSGQGRAPDDFTTGLGVADSFAPSAVPSSGLVCTDGPGGPGRVSGLALKLVHDDDPGRNSAPDFAVCSSGLGAREQSSSGPALVGNGCPADDIIVRIGGLGDDNTARDEGPGNAFARGPPSFAPELVPNGGPSEVIAPDRSSLALYLVHAASHGNRGAEPQVPCYGRARRTT